MLISLFEKEREGKQGTKKMVENSFAKSQALAAGVIIHSPLAFAKG